MAKSSPYPGLEVTVLGVSSAGCEGVFVSRGKRDMCRGWRFHPVPDGHSEPEKVAYGI